MHASAARGASGAAGLRRRIRRHWQMYVILLLPLIYLIIFKYVPMYGLQIAFRRFTIKAGIWNSPWVGAKYFRQFFQSPSFGTVIRNTLTISLYSLVAGFPMPILLAVALNESRALRFKKLVQMVTYAPYFISTVVLVGMMFQLLDGRVGIVNRLLGYAGVEPIGFMSDSALFYHTYVWSGVWQGTGYSAVIYLAALSSVSPELQEAATIDGAGRVGRIWHVDLPCIRGTVVVLLILRCGQLMSVGYEKAYLMQNALNLASSEVISTFVYKVGLQNGQFSFSTAVGLFNSLVNMALLTLANLVAKRFGESGLM